MSDTSTIQTVGVWNSAQKVSFRIAFVFFALLILPLDPHFWLQVHVLHILRWQELFHLTAYSPAFLTVPRWGLLSYGNWVLIACLALAGGLVWTLLDRTSTQYTRLYYLLRAALRYRLAIAAIGYGVMMLFAVQFPRPTLSELNTNYGDLLQWKIYYLTMGVAKTYYQQTLGTLEIVGALLLFTRRYTAFGAGLIASLLLNIVPANIAYQFGDHVYATLLLVFAMAVLAHDGPRLFSLLVLERRATADRTELAPDIVIGPRARIILQGLCVLFVLVYGVQAGIAARHAGGFYPQTAGLANAAGLYNVKEFAVDGKTLPYSPNDPVRWQDVVFEPWNTLSVHIARPMTIDVANPAIAYEPDEKRDYEIAGNGGRHFYSYTQDAGAGSIALKGKNDPQESYAFHCERLRGGVIVLDGKDGKGSALHIVLEKIDKKYLLDAGRRRPVTLY